MTHAQSNTKKVAKSSKITQPELSKNDALSILANALEVVQGVGIEVNFAREERLGTQNGLCLILVGIGYDEDNGFQPLQTETA